MWQLYRRGDNSWATGMPIELILAVWFKPESRHGRIAVCLVSMENACLRPFGVKFMINILMLCFALLSYYAICNFT